MQALEKRLTAPRSLVAASNFTAKALRFLRREVLSRRLQWQLAAGPESSDRFFARMLARNSVDAQLLCGATLRAARKAEARGQFLDASRLWSWHVRAGGDAQKAGRNMVRCARDITRDRLDEAAIQDALKAWRYVGRLPSFATEARQGAAWCHAELARRARRRPDFAAQTTVLDEAGDLIVRRGLERLRDAATASDSDSSGVAESEVLKKASRLIEDGQQDKALWLLGLHSDAPHIAEAFHGIAASCRAEQLTDLLREAEARESKRKLPPLILAVAEAQTRAGDLSRAVEALCGPKEGEGARAANLYLADKKRLAAVVAELVADPRTKQQKRERLAGYIAALAPERVRAFFAGPAFDVLSSDLLAAIRFEHSNPGSRTALLRDNYFDHHTERREGRSVQSFATGFELCEAVLRYFEAVSQLRPTEQIPVSAKLRASLANECLRIGERQWTDALLTYALLRERPDCKLDSPSLYEALAGWFLSSFLPGHNIPGSCLSPALVTHFNAIERKHRAFGIAVTRFARWARSELQLEESYDLENGLDALLLFLMAASFLLPERLQYRQFLAGMVPRHLVDGSFVDLCIASFREGTERSEAEQGFVLLLSNNGEVLGPEGRRPAIPGALPDVLLIGHGGEGTGLSRNFRMLADAFSGSAVNLTTLSYETEAATFAAKLKAWHDECRSTPIVVAAVNAQDIPALFIRDRYSVLDESHVVGFFLWETSAAPSVQHLGVKLVDEIWAPTEYVGNIYAPWGKRRVVGKGLYSAEHPPSLVATRRRITRFLTVFDFHSSIERKNPVACVLAFQQAFQSGEDATLTIKASNVNPQHPGNAFRQWERICEASAQDPRIRLITEHYTDEQMQRLLQESSCVVSLHRSEGFGYVIADAMASGIPVIATDYSGSRDFCTDETSFPVSYELVPVRSSGAHWETEGTVWAEPDIGSAAAQMRMVYKNYPAALAKAKAGRELMLLKYSRETFAATLQARIHEIGAELHGERTSAHGISRQSVRRASRV
jgi:glycosyltransferase involved in cell wall biosynthesis